MYTLYMFLIFILTAVIIIAGTAITIRIQIKGYWTEGWKDNVLGGFFIIVLPLLFMNISLYFLDQHLIETTREKDISCHINIDTGNLRCGDNFYIEVKDE